MQVADYLQDSIVDGPGLRFVLFAQGCPRMCAGCHNPETRDPAGGREMSESDIIAEMLSNPLTDGLTLSGGEPFLQPESCARIARAARDAGLNVWCFTGYTFEELSKMEGCQELLGLVDVLVDGPFIIGERDLSLKWRGSRNQRVLNAKKSLETGSAVMYY